MDQAFRDAMTSGYALTEPGLIIGSADARRRALQRRAGPGRAVDAQPSRPDRGRHRHRQDQDPPAPRGPALEGRRPRLRRRHQGRPDRAGRVRATRRTRRSSSAPTSLGWTFEPSGHPVEFLSLSGKLGAQVRATVHSFGPLLLGKVLDLNDTQTSILVAGLQVLRRQRPAAARPEGPRGDPQVPVVGRRQADPRRLRRDVAGVGRASCCARSSSSSRRAPTSFFGEPEFDVADLIRTTPDGAGIVSILELSRRHGQAAPVLHVHALDARPALRDAARGRRPAEAEAVLLLRRGPPPVRRRVAGAAGPDRADRPADPVEGRRRVLRDPGADRRPVVRPRPARQPRPARAAGVHPGRRRRAAEDRPDLPDDRPTTTSRRRSRRSASARRS